MKDGKKSLIFNENFLILFRDEGVLLMETSQVAGNPAVNDLIVWVEQQSVRNREISQALEQHTIQLNEEINQLLFLISGGRAYKSSSPERKGNLVDLQR